MGLAISMGMTICRNGATKQKNDYSAYQMCPCIWNVRIWWYSRFKLWIINWERKWKDFSRKGFRTILLIILAKVQRILIVNHKILTIMIIKIKLLKSYDLQIESNNLILYPKLLEILVMNPFWYNSPIFSKILCFMIWILNSVKTDILNPTTLNKWDFVIMMNLL
jgi:hypothetical protein